MFIKAFCSFEVKQLALYKYKYWYYKVHKMMEYVIINSYNYNEHN